MNEAEDVTTERLPPEDALELLAHETRFAILDALNGADETPLAFSDLRERVGVRDAGQFNYHLGKLRGRFVGKAAEDGAEESGYELIPAGKRVVGAVLSGSYSKEFDAKEMVTDAPCLECGEPMGLQFREGGVKVTCPDCGDYTDFDVSPGVFEAWPREQFPSVVDRWLTSLHRTAENGFCHNCDGRVDRSVRSAADEDAPQWVREGDLEAISTYECRRCGTGWSTIVPIAVLTHPAVVAFHYEHDVDLRKTAPWDLDWVRPGLAAVTGENPLRIDVPVTLDDERRAFTFDENLDVDDES